MEKKRKINFMFLIIAFILGTALWKDFDFQSLRFEKPALDTVFLITFIVSVYLIIKDLRTKSDDA